MLTTLNPSFRLWACLMVALALVSAACNPADEGRSDAESVPIDGPDEGGDGSDASPSPAEDDSSPATDQVELPKPVALDLEARHPSGSLVRLNGVAFTPNAIELDVTIINGYRLPQNFASISFGGLVLEDDLGNAYGFLVPDDNELLTVESGEQMEGTLVFLGRLPPEATSLRLVFNPTQDDETNNLRPRLALDVIPVRAEDDNRLR